MNFSGNTATVFRKTEAAVLKKESYGFSLKLEIWKIFRGKGGKLMTIKQTFLHIATKKRILKYSLRSDKNS